MKRIALLWLAIAVSMRPPAPAQTPPAKSFVGTVSALKAETAEIEVKPDNAAPVALKIGNTMAQKIAPDEKDLKKAEAIQITEVAVGDRVLVTPEPGTSDLRRIVVMSAADIARRNQADTMDWTRRGVSGVVAAKKGNEITLTMRTLTGEKQAVVTVGDKTTYKRYAPDSVKFVDAKPSNLAEIGVGDQVRARGQKSEDGLKVTAEDVAFGTFLTKAGSVLAVNLDSREVTVKDLTDNHPLVVKFTADSQLKKMPDLGAMMGGMMRPAGGGVDLAQMLERMPPGRLEDLNPGETIVVSSTKGAKNGRIIAIMFLSNAGSLLRMASIQPGGGRSGAAGGGITGGLDLGGISLGGIVP